MPLANTRVIPEGWSAHHQPVVAGSWTADVTIRPPGNTQGEFNPATGTYDDPQPHPAHYTGRARVQVEPMFAGDREAGGQQVTVAGYLVVVDRDTSTGTEVGHIVKVTGVDDNGDPALVGRELTVSGVAYGSLAWERDLTCTDDLG